MRRGKFFEADTGTSIPQAIESVPPAVVHTVTEVPALTKTGGESVAELPTEAIHDTLRGLNTAVAALTLAANRMADKAAWVPPTVEAAIETPMENATEKAHEVSPEVVSPPKDRFIRRNGRKVKRA